MISYQSPHNNIEFPEVEATLASIVRIKYNSGEGKTTECPCVFEVIIELNSVLVLSVSWMEMVGFLMPLDVLSHQFKEEVFVGIIRGCHTCSVCLAKDVFANTSEEE
jgi:hypothetical protein